MPGISHVAHTFLAFLTDLKSRRAPSLSELSRLRNGFEGWLKIELYLWLIERYGLRAGEDVGVEYKVWLDQRRGQMDRATKQCDLWVRDAEAPRTTSGTCPAFWRATNRLRREVQSCWAQVSMNMPGGGLSTRQSPMRATIRPRSSSK